MLTTTTSRLINEAIDRANEVIMTAARKAATQEQEGAVDELRAAITTVIADMEELVDLRTEYIRKATAIENRLHRASQKLEEAQRTVTAEVLAA